MTVATDPTFSAMFNVVATCWHQVRVTALVTSSEQALIKWYSESEAQKLELTRPGVTGTTEVHMPLLYQELAPSPTRRLQTLGICIDVQ